jgi:hypothetical protein
VAWWAGSRSAARAAAERDSFREAMHRYALTPQETAQVEFSVTWGRELQDERLRPAAVVWAQQLIDERGPGA